MEIIEGQFSEGHLQKKQYIGQIPKKGGLGEIANLREGFVKKEGGVFWGG